MEIFKIKTLEFLFFFLISEIKFEKKILWRDDKL